MASFLALGCIFVVGWLIIQRYRSQAVLLFGGFGMMLASYLLGTKLEFVDPKFQTGLWLFDMFEYVNRLASKDVAGLGLMIMTCMGFAKYMDHIGASSRLVALATKPLSRLRAPYVVLVLGFLLNILMSLPVPSLSGLAMLMMVTLFPILVGLGLSRPAAASVVVTGHLLDWGPASATSLLVSRTAEIPLTTYFVEYQIPVYFFCAITTAITHYFWQKHLDKKDGVLADPVAASNGTGQTGEKKGAIAPGPLYYIVLPVLPIILLLGFSEYGYQGIKMTVNVAMFFSLAFAMLCELVRYKGNFRIVCDSIQVFFKGMGEQYAMTVTLVTAGQTFAYGLQCLGVVGTVIAASQTLGVSAWILACFASLIIFIFGMIMGSGVAPLFAFIPLMPKFSADLGVSNAVLMMHPLQNAASLGRLLSPITAGVVAVSSIAQVSPFELVRRNFMPVVVAYLTSTLATYMLYW